MKELILNFHGVGEPPPWVRPDEGRYWWDEGPFFAALDELAAASRGSHVTRITFDDGNESDIRIALPALTKRGMTASFFVCAGRIGERGYLGRSEICELVSAGMRIGSHGYLHRDWRRLDCKALSIEIVEAKRKLEDLCGCNIDEAGIPFGSYDRRVLGKLRSNGFRCAYSSDGGFARSDSWLKERNTLDRSWQGKSILRILTPDHGLLGRFRKTVVKTYKALR